jgi:formylglycine-generating enzyme
LPTEAEWEFAARGGKYSKGFEYSGSNDINESGWFYANSANRTHGVGTKIPNELGIYDMSGNVWEWCSDWYDKNYYKIGKTINPTGPSSGEFKVLRGGSWRLKNDCPISFRNWGNPLKKYDADGFRIVREE